jgi:hypothetical protein
MKIGEKRIRRKSSRISKIMRKYGVKEERKLKKRQWRGNIESGGGVVESGERLISMK